jgi:hypothetical protein
VPKQHIKRRKIRPSLGVFQRCQFYRGGFQTNGLRTLLWRTLISISCNVALGEPNHFLNRPGDVGWGNPLLFVRMLCWPKDGGQAGGAGRRDQPSLRCGPRPL